MSSQSQDSVSVEEETTVLGLAGSLSWRHTDWILTPLIHFIYSTNIYELSTVFLGTKKAERKQKQSQSLRHVPTRGDRP